MMLNVLRKRISKTGLSPGTLVFTGEQKLENPELTLFVYNADHCEQIKDVQIDSCLLQPVDHENIWINVAGLHDIELIEKLNKNFNIHPLVIEDILITDQRAKVEEFDDYLFVTLRALSWNETTQTFFSEQISIIFGKGYLLSFQEENTPLFAKIQERLWRARSRLRQHGSDYLAYALLDIIVDHYFVILEKLEEIIDVVEGSIIKQPMPNDAHNLYYLKQQMYAFRKAVWPLREVINQLLRSDSGIISDYTTIYLRDVYDHTIQTIEMIETFRDMLASMLDFYLSNITNRMNEIIKVLTIISTIFIPITFIASIYGMNFTNIPELQWRWGYPVNLRCYDSHDNHHASLL